ncbi:hypothetical protein K6119_18440 [Paracrocinitomix mangrovi]|uniref:hypothetical protein n=1 Tax=Paracrocinitomix mangrovi TaxID=2862509 RepID=UPI001C8DE050|nr:hypothetical protein [Paracrocinitomix mangrovi]UKN01706.1 hypothetical protein K6119_18440 [Paracrocinitomix mangrovi]
MEVLRFIFILGINFSIFSFIWGIIMFLLKLIQPPQSQGQEGLTYIFRIIKYFLLVSVTANFISVYEMGNAGAKADTMHIVIGSIVMGLYLLGKLQNRHMMNQFAQHPMFSRMVPKVDPKVEQFLLIGSVIYFVICLMYPGMVNNGLNNWFTQSIISIYEAPIIGWIFSFIAFFFLISILMRGANVVMRILNGQSPMDNPKMNSSFHFQSNFGRYENQEDEEDENDVDEDGFTDYEDVTDENEKQ